MRFSDLDFPQEVSRSFQDLLRHVSLVEDQCRTGQYALQTDKSAALNMVRLELEELVRLFVKRVIVTFPVAQKDADRVVEFIAIAFLDEKFIQLDWEMSNEWSENPLETEIFGTRNAGTEIFDRIDAMTDPRHFQVAQRIRNHIRPAPFARMTGQFEPRLACHIERIRKIAGPALHFRASKAQTRNEIAFGFHGAFCRSLGLFGTKVTNASDNTPQRDAQIGFGLCGLFFDRVQIFTPSAHITATAEIRRQESFGIDHAMFSAFFQHGAGQARKILGALQRCAGSFVDRQEMFEISVQIAAIFIENSADIDVLFLGQPANKRRRRGALEMQVEFDFR